MIARLVSPGVSVLLNARANRAALARLPWNWNAPERLTSGGVA